MQMLLERKKLIIYSDNIFRQEKYLCFLACLIFVSTSVVHFFNSVIRFFIKNSFKLDTLFIYCIFFYIVLSCVKLILNRNNYTGLIVILIISFLILFSMIFFQVDYNLMLKIFKGIVLAVPWFFVGFAICDFKLLRKYLKIGAYIVLCCTLLQMLFFGDIFSESYSQTMGYTFLPVCLILLDNIFNKIKIIDLFSFFISTILLIAMGARGPLGALAIYFCIRLLYFIVKSRFIGFIVFIILCSILSIIFIFYNDILIMLRNLFTEIGLSTRVVDALMNKNLLLDPIREKQYLYIIELIKSNPFGYGVGYDRMLISEYMEGAYSAEISYGWYSHNIILDLFLNFGVIIGTCLLLGLCYLLIRNIFLNKNEEKKQIIFIFIALGLVPLFVSGYFLEDTFFMFLIGILLNNKSTSEKCVI